MWAGCMPRQRARLRAARADLLRALRPVRLGPALRWAAELLDKSAVGRTVIRNYVRCDTNGGTNGDGVALAGN